MGYRYIITLPIGSGWPEQHCTLIYWFRFGPTLCEGKLREKLLQWKTENRLEYIKLVSERPKLFGFNYNVPVHVLRPNRKLRKLHNSFYDFLVSEGCTFKNSSWVGPGYQPHVTDAGGRKFLPGSTYQANRLRLIRSDTLGRKEVVGNFN